MVGKQGKKKGVLTQTGSTVRGKRLGTGTQMKWEGLKYRKNIDEKEGVGLGPKTGKTGKNERSKLKSKKEGGG